ncbi:hypothetical protein [Xanthomonas sp. NCPPB 2632]|uniref:hypothetical protein n=1 Tax=Xanthomonas sp. NCPPB 2632 TaxID=3240912 RepID=UPI0035138D96
MTEDELITAILAEMARVWGESGLHGEPDEYAWLESTYGITEDDDVKWQMVLQYRDGELPEDDREDQDVMAFLHDETAVVRFLEGLLKKYQSSAAVYLGS